MEIRVKCNDYIELRQFVKLNNVDCEVLSHNLNGDTLNGDVKIYGDYVFTEKEIEKIREFENIVPFSLVFRSNNIEINKIEIENKSFKIKDDKGIETSFDLVVNYSIKDIDQNDSDDVIPVPVEINEEEMVHSEISDELIDVAEEINQSYNEILDQLLDIREKCDDENNVEVKEIEDNKVDLSKMICKNSLIEIYYLNNEKQVESIANERKIPVSNLYKKNSDFNETKRIIIYEY